MSGSRLAAALLLLASSASAAVSPTYTRQFPGTVVTTGQASCTAGGVTFLPDNRASSPTAYDRVSVLIKNAAALGGADLFICPGSATCTIGTGFPLGPHEGVWLDWSNGPITCVVATGTVTVAYIEERG